MRLKENPTAMLQQDQGARLPVFSTVHRHSKAAATLCPETFPSSLPLCLLIVFSTAADTEVTEHNLF